MKTVVCYEDLTLGSTGRSLDLSATEKTLANLSLADGSPLISSWFDPDPKFLRQEGPTWAWRDRSEGKKFVNSLPYGITLDTAIGSKPTVGLGGTYYFVDESIASPGAFRADQWSLACVFKFTGAAASRVLVGPTADAGSDAATYSPFVSFSTSGVSGVNLGLRVIRGDTAVRISDTTHEYKDVPVCLIVGFSTAKGLTLRRNGVEVATAPSATQPLTATKYQLFGSKTATNRFPGDAGHFFVCDDDLTAAGNAAALSSIEGFLMDWYAIS